MFESIVEQTHLRLFSFSSFHVLFFLAILLVIIGKALRVLEDGDRPKLFHIHDGAIRGILARCPSLHERYQPTVMWGKSGHIQTILLSKFGRFNVVLNSTSRKSHTVYAEDGASVDYDIFRPSEKTKVKRQEILLVVPGIGNHSETVYIQGFTQQCVAQGFTVAVYNHVGAVKSTKLTAPRIFTYGGTKDLELVIKSLESEHSAQKFIGIGFSMGANILLKYLGEQPDRQSSFICAASVCQGYDIARSAELFLQWDNMRRGYNWAITQVMKSVLLRHAETLSQSEVLPLQDPAHWQRVQSASSLHHLDEYMKCFDGFDSALEFYRWSSSSTYMQKLDLPVLLLNAGDDPMVPEALLASPKRLVARNPHSCLVISKHGGHLGFFEGGYVIPNPVSWLDRVLLEYVTAVIATSSDENCQERAL